MKIHILMDFQQIFKCQVSRKSVDGSSVVPCGRTDGRIDMTKLYINYKLDPLIIIYS